MAFAFCFGAGAALTACGNSSTASTSSTGEAPAANGYKFKVVNADGSAAVGYMVLLCKGADACGIPQVTNEKGETTVLATALPNVGGVSAKADAYDIHIMAPGSSTYLEYEGPEKTPAEFSDDTITITLK